MSNIKENRIKRTLLIEKYGDAELLNMVSEIRLKYFTFTVSQVIDKIWENE